MPLDSGLQPTLHLRCSLRKLYAAVCLAKVRHTPSIPAGVLLLFFLGTALLGCGSRTNSHFSLTPTEEFDGDFEENPAKKACSGSKSHGCASVQTSGTAVNGSFNFDDLFVRCESSSLGTNISIKNMAVEGATFQVSINLYKVTSPNGLYECMGPQVVANPPEIELKPGYCDIVTQVHSLKFSTKENERCYLTVTSQNPIQGQLLCATLTRGEHSLSIAEGSQFACQK